MDIHSDKSVDLLRQLVDEGRKARRVATWCAICLVALVGVLFFKELNESKPEADVLSWRDIRLSRQQADLPKALRQSDELLAKKPRDDKGLYRKGEILLMMGDRDGARACFEQAYEILPIDGYKRAVDAMKVVEAEVKTLSRGTM